MPRSKPSSPVNFCNIHYRVMRRNDNNINVRTIYFKKSIRLEMLHIIIL